MIYSGSLVDSFIFVLEGAPLSGNVIRNRLVRLLLFARNKIEGAIERDNFNLREGMLNGERVLPTNLDCRRRRVGDMREFCQG